MCLQTSDLQPTTLKCPTLWIWPRQSMSFMQQIDCTPGWAPNRKHNIMIILVGSCTINQRRSRRRGEAQHTSLSASTYKRLSFILLKCYLINVLVTLNISTAGGTFVIVELAGRVGHRWELLPHAGVDVRAAVWTRWAHVIDHPGSLVMSSAGT